MHNKTLLLIAFLLALSPPLVFGQANGKLQMHFMDVGQGDGAVLISPQGQVVLFDNGVRNRCDRPVTYLQQLGITQIDYHIASHYHDDHIGCTREVLTQFPLLRDAIDRGESYPSTTYNRYVEAVGSHRVTAAPGMRITLDEGTSSPVNIDIVALNGDGISVTDENSLSVVAVVRFGNFDIEMGGDLSGTHRGQARDIETSLGPLVGQVEVYKAHHHGSSYSSNALWLAAISPAIAIVSVGAGNPYGHPAQDFLDRIHQTGIKSFWTESGNGGMPDPAQDEVGGTIVVEAAPDSDTFTVTHHGTIVETFPLWGASVPMFSWSSRAVVYHYSTCRYVGEISPPNLVQADTPPPGRRLHQGCPSR